MACSFPEEADIDRDDDIGVDTCGGLHSAYIICSSLSGANYMPTKRQARLHINRHVVNNKGNGIHNNYGTQRYACKSNCLSDVVSCLFLVYSAS